MVGFRSRILSDDSIPVLSPRSQTACRICVRCGEELARRTIHRLGFQIFSKGQYSYNDLILRTYVKSYRLDSLFIVSNIELDRSTRVIPESPHSPFLWFGPSRCLKHMVNHRTYAGLSTH